MNHHYISLGTDSVSYSGIEFRQYIIFQPVCPSFLHLSCAPCPPLFTLSPSLPSIWEVKRAVISSARQKWAKSDLSFRQQSLLGLILWCLLLLLRGLTLLQASFLPPRSSIFLLGVLDTGSIHVKKILKGCLNVLFNVTVCFSKYFALFKVLVSKQNLLRTVLFGSDCWVLLWFMLSSRVETVLVPTKELMHLI